MSKIRDNLNVELENISFDISADTIRKKAKAQTIKRNTTITTIVCACVISLALCCGALSGNDKLTVKIPTIEATIPTEIATIQNTFTISACALGGEQSIEKSVSNNQNDLSADNTNVQVTEHRISINEFIGGDGKIHYTFIIGKSYYEKLDEYHTRSYGTEPVVYVTGDNIKNVKFTADIVELPRKMYTDIEFLEYATQNTGEENEGEKIHSKTQKMPLHYTRVPLPAEFNDLCIKCNETDYQFKFSDIPVVTITIDITFENGEVQQKQVQTYYNDEGYFTVRGC